MAPLFQAGTFRRNDDSCPTAIVVWRGDEAHVGYCRNVEAENMLQDPARLVENQIDRPKRQLVDGAFNGPVFQGLPTQKQEMEAHYQYDEKRHVDGAGIFRVFAVFPDAFDRHYRSF